MLGLWKWLQAPPTRSVDERAIMSHLKLYIGIVLGLSGCGGRSATVAEQGHAGGTSVAVEGAPPVRDLAPGVIAPGPAPTSGAGSGGADGGDVASWGPVAPPPAVSFRTNWPKPAPAPSSSIVPPPEAMDRSCGVKVDIDPTLNQMRSCCGGKFCNGQCSSELKACYCGQTAGGCGEGLVCCEGRRCVKADKCEPVSQFW
jgi:hypothetical protein